MKIIAIDPGLGKSGVAVWDNGVFTNMDYLNLEEVFMLVNNNADNTKSGGCLFLVENSDLIKSSWHGPSGRSNVGKNKGVSKEIVLHIKRKGVPFVELRPDGYSSVYRGNKARLFAIDTGWHGSSNEHNRAAAAMILRHLKLGKLQQQMQF
jgi:hypothetical protein